MIETCADNGLTSEYAIRCANSREDVERVAELNDIVHGAAGLTRALFLHHPATDLADLLFIEHVSTKRVVSSLCLIPWVWRLGGVEVLAGEMGLVGTLDSHRGRGLVRALVTRFYANLAKRGCHVSHIQGIPGFYDQFGYEYCTPLEGGIRLELRDIHAPAGDGGLKFRRAGPDDAADLAALYRGAASALSLSAQRDDETWRYLLTHASSTQTSCERWLVSQGDERPLGYFTVPRYHFGEELVLTEASPLNAPAALAVLRKAADLAQEAGKPGIRLNLPANCTLMRLARSLGGHDLGTYAWQVLVPDVARLLRVLAPVLEKRVARSPFAGLCRRVDVGLYRATVQMHFECGRIERVETVQSVGEASIRLPKRRFVQLLFGSHSLEELEARHPDVLPAPADRMLIEALFPPLNAFLYQPY